MSKFSKVYNQDQKTIKNMLSSFHNKWIQKEHIVKSIIFGEYEESEKQLFSLFEEILNLSEYFDKQNKRIQKIFKQKTVKKYGKIMKKPFMVLFEDLNRLRLSITKRKAHVRHL